MSTTTTEETGTFEYNPQYKLLICRQCRYAVQKNALESHLLRHKIYRGHRQRLLSSIAHLDILEPQHVPLPPPGSPPVDLLPVFPGFRCSRTGCRHLTASTKRMQRHWSEAHGLNSSIQSLSSLACPVTLQTFFRGTKVKYFEVALSPASRVGGSDSDIGDNNEERTGDGFGGTETCVAAVNMPPCAAGVVEATSDVPSTNFDLKTLVYFHHFTTVTSSTLPSGQSSHNSEYYWQVHVVGQALQLHWLMCGLLAISAYHLSVTASEPLTKQNHREHACQFSSAFSTGFQQTASGDFELKDTTKLDEDSKQIAEQIRCLLQCADWASTESRSKSELAASQSLPSFLSAIRGCTSPESISLHSTPSGDESEMQAETPSAGSSRHGGQSHANPNHRIPPLILDHLDTLLSRMADRLERPKNVQDVFATMSARDTLIECCAISFARDDLDSVWRGVVAWLHSTTPHFDNMVSCRHPAALVLLAHWAAILVKRAENLGCWVLRGVAGTIVQLVVRELALGGGGVVLDLVEGLGGMVGD